MKWRKNIKNTMIASIVATGLLTVSFTPSLSLAASKTTITTASKTSLYTVKRGDTLYRIAASYKTSVANVKKINKLKTDTVKIGQKLKVPVVTSKTPVKTTAPKATEKISPPNPIAYKSVDKEVLGFTVKYNLNDVSSYNIMKKQHDSLTSIATATHVVDGNGNIHGTVPAEQLALANENHIKPTLMVGNEFNSKVAHQILSSKTNRNRMVNNILSILQNNGYKGVNIDLENVDDADRNGYSTLIKELSGALKPKGFVLSVSLQPKTSDNPRHTWVYAYDYKTIGKYVDYMLVMTYDEHYKSSNPGSVASISWVNNVIKYTKSVVPANKILLGVGSYGYDWSLKGQTKSHSFEEIMEIAKKYKATIRFDSVSKTPHFSYKDEKGVVHQVWFENAQSIAYKLDIIKREGLKGIGIWRLGHNFDDTYWNTIDSKL
ncbi:glycosyl hydrolase family 18 protein [Peribacillus saganii]|nr:glycosyl hydrolase family 18 protein [Peribacillus saganii]